MNVIGKFAVMQQKGDTGEKSIINIFENKPQAEEFINSLPKDKDVHFSIEPITKVPAPNKTMDVDNFHDINLNDNKRKYTVSDDINLSSKTIETFLKNKYPNTTIDRIDGNHFKLTTKDGSREALVSTRDGIHTIEVTKKMNESLQNYIEKSLDTIFENTVKTIFEGFKLKKEWDEAPFPGVRKPTPYTPPPGPDRDHHAVIHTDIDVSRHPGVSKNSAGEHILAITKDEHHQFQGIGHHGRNTDENDLISDEQYRDREKPKHEKSILSKYLPGVSGKITDTRPSHEPEVNNHYALLHVPEHAEKDMNKLSGVNKSPKGKYYVNIPKHIHDMVKRGNSSEANVLVGNKTGWHKVNHDNNPNKGKFAPNYHMDHAIKIDTVLSPEDVANMRQKK